MSDLREDESDPLAEMPFLGEALSRAGVSPRPAPARLYHYTSPEGLIEILKSGKLIATDAHYFNDTSEGEFGFAILEPELKRFDRTGLTVIAAEFHRLIAQRRAEPVFVSCFCEAGDHLGQWRGYSTNGAGYAIGLPFSALAGNGLVPLVKVTYGEDAVRKACVDTIEWALATIDRIRDSQPEDGAEQLNNLLTSTVTALLLVVLASKKSVFSPEAEWRIAYPRYSFPVFNPNRVSFRNSEGLVVPYIKVPLPRDENGRLRIASVTCGPTRHEDRRRHGVIALLQALKLTDTEVLESEAPLRR